MTTEELIGKSGILIRASKILLLDSYRRLKNQNTIMNDEIFEERLTNLIKDIYELEFEVDQVIRKGP